MVVGTPLYAMFSGQARSRVAGTGGWAVTIYRDGPGSVIGETFHHSRFVPKLGGAAPSGTLVRVTEGELIGYSGGKAGAQGAGNSTGPHCHTHVYPRGVLAPRQSTSNYLRSLSLMPALGTGITLLPDPYVRQVQELAKAAGYAIVVDGYKGPKTEAVMRQVQADLGLKVDGIAGPATVGALEAKIAAKIKAEAAARARADAAKRAAELAARLAKESANMVTLIKDNEKPIESGYLVTPDGIVPISDHGGLSGGEVFALFRRLRDAQRNGTEPQFNRQEIAIMNHFFTLPVK